MYNLRARARAVPAGSARPHLGMGARAPPTVASSVASQITPTQAMEILDDVDTVPDTEMPNSDSDEKIDADKSVVEMESVEATQPPILTPHTPPETYTSYFINNVRFIWIVSTNWRV